MVSPIIRKAEAENRGRCGRGRGLRFVPTECPGQTILPNGSSTDFLPLRVTGPAEPSNNPTGDSAYTYTGSTPIAAGDCVDIDDPGSALRVVRKVRCDGTAGPWVYKITKVIDDAFDPPACPTTGFQISFHLTAEQFVPPKLLYCAMPP
jgi:hypothetical protein